MAGTAFKVDWDDEQAQAMFQRLLSFGSNLVPLFTEIGSELEDSTRQRILSGGPAPDGTPWVPLVAMTLATKTTSKPLIERGDLLNSIRFETGPDFVDIIAGPTDYAAVHQFGTGPYVIRPKKGQALKFGPGAGIVRRSVNHPGVPARPFLGASEQDREAINDATSSYLERLARG